MKDVNSPILDKIARRDGMTVPEGYFADFASKMEAQLPARNFQIVRPMTFWGRVRPYVYMAAMFAGVWCMLKMFTQMTGTNEAMSFDNTPELAEAAADTRFVDTYYVGSLNDYDIIDQMDESFVDGSAFDSAIQADAIDEPSAYELYYDELMGE